MRIRRSAPLVAALLATFSIVVPSLAFGSSTAVAVAAGSSHTCALTDAGGVTCWGNNGNGQLGDGTTTTRPSPTDVTGLTSGVAAVAAGSSHTCALTTGGGVKCWGLNSSSQLGDGTTTSHSTPTDVVGLTSGVVALAAGGNHTCAVTSGGGAKCWGNNAYGQLGDGTTTNRPSPIDVTGLTSGVVAVAAGGSHTCALTTGGGARCWGNNASGQLGDGTTTNRPSPIDVTGLTSNVVAVAAGGSHTCALTTSGGAKCWGNNFYGQLGDGTTTNRSTATDVMGLTSGVLALASGGGHVCALTDGGGAKCWGNNTSGQLGDGTMTSHPTATDVTGLTSGVLVLAAGSGHTCAVTSTGGISCAGGNAFGQLGDGTSAKRLTPTDVTGLTSGVAVVVAGSSHTCALTTGGGVKCWGSNSAGQLGDGTTSSGWTPRDVTGLTSGVLALAAGGGHTCALTTAGGAKCWGSNSSGQLGDGTTTSRPTPADVVGLTSGVVALAAGGSHTCAVTTGGGAKCWGLNSSGQLGDGTTTSSATPRDVTGLASGVLALAAGGSGGIHTCAVTTGGGLKCWGEGDYGRLGDGSGTSTDRLTPTNVSGLASGVAAVAAGYSDTCALTTSGGAKCWGYNFSGELGDGTTTNRYYPADVTGLTSGVAALAAGGVVTCALTVGGGAKCWGGNGQGEVGDGTTTNRLSPTDVTGLTSGVATLAAGGEYNCAVTTGGGAKCWGYNGSGQLGDPAGRPRLTPVSVLDFGVAPTVAQVAPASGPVGGGTRLAVTGTGFAAGKTTVTVGGVAATGVIVTSANALTATTPAGSAGAVTVQVTTQAGAGEKTAAFTYATHPAAWRLDFDRHGGTDLSVYRPTTGEWFVQRSSGGTWTAPFGAPGDQVLDGDFDGDGARDPAVYRPSTGTWFWLKSSAGLGELDFRGWGLQAEGDVPAPGDYDGDGKTDLTVFRPQYGTWFVLTSSSHYTQYAAYGWGGAGDQLVPDDYDGDGTTDIAVFRPSTGQWFILPSSTGFTTGWAPITFGAPTDVPVRGDFDGDGKRDIAVYRAATGTWFILRSSSNNTQYDTVGWGIEAQGDTPVPGDYDADGTTDICVYRPAYGTWFVLTSSSGRTQYTAAGWGAASDLPLGGAR